MDPNTDKVTDYIKKNKESTFKEYDYQIKKNNQPHEPSKFKVNDKL
jgi:hypothetical protein